MDSLSSTLYAEWLSDDPRHEFWEVRFNLCLKRKIIDELKPLRRIFENEYSPGQQQDDNGSIYDPTEHLPDDSALSPELLAVARMMLVQIPEPWRTAFYLKHCEEWVEESNDPQQPSIARHLGVTGRSVRNYLRHAEKFLLDSFSTERH
jgi:DNA-directed RNA polymerase specialized sigma24 family protein